MRGWFGVLLVAGLSFLPAVASANFLGIVGMDVMSQSVRQEGHSAITGNALRFRIASDDLPPGLSLMPSVEYWRDKDELEDFDVSVMQKDWRFGVDLRYDWQWGSWSPYAGGGIGWHEINSSFEAPNFPE